jgi:hypothetical protein
MERQRQEAHKRRWGIVCVEAEGGACIDDLRKQGVVAASSVSRYVWRPAPELADQLPPSFSLAMHCMVAGEARSRWFYPIGSFERFITDAFAGGLALLCKIRDLGPEARYSYRAMWQFFQRVRRTREHLRNVLLNATSLRVSRSARGITRDYSILPASVGLNDRGEGTPWDVGRLLQEGAKEAKRRGVAAPREEHCVHYGLVQAARLNPLYLSEEQIPPLIRQALYETILVDDLQDGGSMEDAHDLVLERSLQALWEHLGDRAARLDSWLLGPKNSFVRQLAQPKRAPGGTLERALVRRVLLDLGWDAYSYVAGCIHVMMHVFRKLLPEPLAEAEDHRFAQMYLKQAYIGGLPLALLIERFGFLQSVLWDIWEDLSGGDGPPVLHRLLAYYGEMAAARRAADRMMKGRKAAGSSGGYAVECPLDRAADLATHEAAVPEQFQEIASLLRRDQNIRCRCNCAVPDWHDRVIGDPTDKVTLSHYCAGCGFETSTTVSMQDLQRLALQLHAGSDER